MTIRDATTARRFGWVRQALLAMGVGALVAGAASLAPTRAAGGAAQTRGTDGAPIVPFTIDVPDTVLADLHERLAQARFPDELDGDGWTSGTSLAYLRELVTYWRESFDWREQERRLNELDQFTTEIDGLDVHFIHQRSEHPDALPLLIIHGWPGSVMEFTKIIDPLTDPERYGGRAEDAFHVVIPSIPGFGFSDKPRERGYDPDRMAATFTALMARLGYTRYGIQGGDWGAIIGPSQAILDATRVVGLHVNMCTATPPSGAAGATDGLSAADRERWEARQAFQAAETGYSQIQGTRPQTLGYGLNDSPVGLAAWIVEKFRTWCDCDGHPETAFTKDELLTNITIYWVTQTAASSARLYYEARHATESRRRGRVEVPTACAAFAKEPFWSPRPWVETRYNLVRWTDFPRGGHFAALEVPELLVDDVRAFFRDLRP